MDFPTASDRMSKARQAWRQWNRENPQRTVAWEWVEEAAIHWLYAEVFSGRDTARAQESLARHEEYAKRLPMDLLDRVFAESGFAR